MQAENVEIWCFTHAFDDRDLGGQQLVPKNLEKSGWEVKTNNCPQTGLRWRSYVVDFLIFTKDEILSS